MRLSFERRFCMAHRLQHSQSPKCAVPHGHNETVRVDLVFTGAAFDQTANMGADFSELKRRWHGWIDAHVDHALQLGDADPLLNYFRAYEPQTLDRVMCFPGDPTTEILAAAFLIKLSAFLAVDGAPYAAERVSIEETPTNHVSIDQHGLRLFPALEHAGWWSRPDMSINDFDAALRDARAA